jgi:hypothetical protein
VFGVDSDSSKSPTPDPSEVIILDPNKIECKDEFPIHLRYDWTRANPGRQDVCCCKVNDNLFHF